MTIRLNKVTRDLNVGITTVVDFLQKKGYTVEANPNTKITEEQYAALVKEFSKDKDLKIESEKIIQERQNKERNKASVSIEDIHPELKKPEVIETVVPEDVRPKFKPVGKIDLDGLKKKKKPAVVEPAETPVVQEGPAKPEPENKQAEVEKTEVKTEEAPVQQPQVEEKQEPKQPEIKAEELKPEPMEEEKKQQSVQENKEDEVFKIRPTEFKSKINVVGQIDLAALNQSTRPKKKSKEEKKKEREEKDKKKYPKMKLAKKIDLKGCGTGRQLRFGHLLGTKEYQMVMAQCQKRVNRDAYGTISCLTAMDLDGNILWQHGEPTDNTEIGSISADMPMQIYDIDGDGYDEVITAKNFEEIGRASCRERV